MTTSWVIIGNDGKALMEVFNPVNMQKALDAGYRVMRIKEYLASLNQSNSTPLTTSNSLSC